MLLSILFKCEVFLIKYIGNHMYEQYYSLKFKPFTLLPDPKFLYLSNKHSLAYSMLEYGLSTETGGYVVITGETGTGKTTLINKLIHEIRGTVTLGLVSYTSGDFDELLQLILVAFNLEYRNKSKIERYQDLMSYLENQYNDKRCVLIIDEAQNIDIDTLEQLRMLSNINSDEGQKIQLVLSGQPNLLSNLKSPDLIQLSQRVSIQYNIETLTKEECIEYISHRLSVAGSEINIFDEVSINWVWYYSRGIPRIINSICDLALVYGYAVQKTKIDLDIIKDVIRDRKIGGLFFDASKIHNVEEFLVSEN